MLQHQRLIQVIYNVRHILITVGPSSSSNQHSGLSSGAIGGIVGGILGTLLLICVAALFFVLGRRTKQAPATSPEAPPPLKESGIEKSDGGGLVVQQGGVAETDLGGRLRYPTDSDIGGRLGTLD